MRNEGAAGFGGAHAASEAIKEPRSEVAFELLNLLRERRLRDAAALGGAAETACVRDGAGISQLMEFHRHILYAEWELYICAMVTRSDPIGCAGAPMRAP